MNKTLRYIGLAKKAGCLVTGTNTSVFSMNRRKVSLVILPEDISENGRKKIMKTIRQTETPYVMYGKSEELSRAAGSPGRNVFSITDSHFAETILQEIERERLKEDV